MKYLYTVIFVGITFFGFAQEKNKETNTFFEKMEYAEAAKQYELDFLNGNNSKELLQKLGDAYYLNTNMADANKWYGKLMEKYINEVDLEYIFKYAQSFKGIGKLSDLNKWMKLFAEKNKTSIENESGEKELVLQQDLEQDHDFRLKNVSINTLFSDFGPMYYGNKIIYASEINSSYNQPIKNNLKQQPFLNLYIGSINKEGNDIEMINNFSKVINSKYHEATLSFSPDLKKVYYTRNNYNGKGKIDNGRVNRLKLYSATEIIDKDGKTEWGNIKELPFNSKDYSVGHPAVSNDGAKLYFVSDMPGSIGETDIFVVDILGEDQYSKPKNLGSKINTAAREMFPFITENSLYFASDGHQGLGGLDIFESKLTADSFETPINLGAPLNSALDDFGFIINEQEENGFVCSNRNFGKGGDDIYFFERTLSKHCEQKIKGYISNNVTGERISDAKIVLYSNSGEILSETQTKINGEYAFENALNCDLVYKISVQKLGYKSAEKLALTSNRKGETVVPIGLDFINELIVEENGLLKIKIGIIYFDIDKFNIREDAAREFNKVVLLMNQYPKMIINIESHTDSRGPDNYNLTLSNERARATKNYIIEHGINSERILNAVGYGETQLMNECKNGVTCADALHQLNRRSEFIILKIY